ncbi:Anthranilate phosphoribosyltransferase OS=Streptomyces tendae OX=1932 GN=trpD PE=3 SV=1 [Streptomyces tendae]
MTEEAFDPRDVGLDLVPVEALRGADASYNADVARRLLAGEPGPGTGRGAAELGGGAGGPGAGPGHRWPNRSAPGWRAAESIDSGAARRVLDRWVAASHA